MRDMIGDLFGYQRKEKSRAYVAIGTLSGILLGVAAGLLVAPQSGEETRKQIKKAAEKGYSKALDAGQKVGDYVKAKGQEVAERFNSAREDVEEGLDKAVGKAAEKVKEGAEKVADKAEKVKEDSKK